MGTAATPGVRGAHAGQQERRRLVTVRGYDAGRRLLHRSERRPAAAGAAVPIRRTPRAGRRAATGARSAPTTGVATPPPGRPMSVQGLAIAGRTGGRAGRHRRLWKTCAARPRLPIRVPPRNNSVNSCIVPHESGRSRRCRADLFSPGNLGPAIPEHQRTARGGIVCSQPQLAGNRPSRVLPRRRRPRADVVNEQRADIDALLDEAREAVRCDFPAAVPDHPVTVRAQRASWEVSEYRLFTRVDICGFIAAGACCGCHRHGSVRPHARRGPGNVVDAVHHLDWPAE